MKLKIKEITLISILSVVLFVQKELLSFLPNISLTMFLIVLYSKKLGLYKTSLIILIYCLLDNLILNSFSILFTPFQMFGWLLVPVLICLVFRNVTAPFQLSLLGCLSSFLYCWIYLIPNVLVLKIDLYSYFLSDVLFEILFAVSNFLSIYLMYEPCSKAFEIALKKIDT